MNDVFGCVFGDLKFLYRLFNEDNLCDTGLGFRTVEVASPELGSKLVVVEPRNPEKAGLRVCSVI